MAKRRRSLPAFAASERPEATASSAHVGASSSDMSMSSWMPFAGSADADLLPDLDRLVPRSRDMMRNNGLASGVQQTLKDNIVGHILRLSTMPDYRLLGWTKEEARAWGNQVEAEFRSWADTTECDAARELNLLGLTLQALGGANMNGDALALPLWLPEPGEKWSTRMMMVEADRLATPPELGAREDIRGGIERDHYGAPVAYYVLKRHPGDIYASNGFFSSGLAAWDRIPATTAWGRRRVIHLHDKERTGQSRGKPLVTAVMREFSMAGKYSTTELEAAVNNSLIAAFLESDLDPDSAAALFGAFLQEREPDANQTPDRRGDAATGRCPEHPDPDDEHSDWPGRAVEGQGTVRPDLHTASIGASPVGAAACYGAERRRRDSAARTW